MERRLIDANALKEAFEEDGHLSGYIEEFIDDCPTIDAVEVVRCIDCEQADLGIPTIDGIVYCNSWDTCTIYDGYCHHGKKRRYDDGERPDFKGQTD